MLLAMLALTWFPVAFPQLTRLITGLNVSDSRFIRSHETFLRHMATAFSNGDGFKVSKSVSENCQKVESAREESASSPPPSSEALRRTGRPSPPPASALLRRGKEERERISQTRSKVNGRSKSVCS